MFGVKGEANYEIDELDVVNRCFSFLDWPYIRLLLPREVRKTHKGAIELTRAVIKLEKKEIIAKNMDLTSGEESSILGAV